MKRTEGDYPANAATSSKRHKGQEAPTASNSEVFTNKDTNISEEQSVASQQAAAYYNYMYQAAYNAYAPYLTSTSQDSTPQQTSQEAPKSPARTIYLGNIPTDITYEEIFNTIRHGIVECCRILPEKKCAFIDFVELSSAISYFTDAAKHGGTIHLRKQTVRVSYAKSSVLPRNIQTAVSSGASRVLYLSGLSDEKISEVFLRKSLESFGPIELIKLLHDKRTVFVYFVSIKSCSQAVQSLTIDSEKLWKGIKIGYGKDRCSFTTSSTIATSRPAAPTSSQGHRLPFPPSFYQTVSYPTAPQAIQPMVQISSAVEPEHQIEYYKSLDVLKCRVIELESLVEAQAKIIESQASLIDVSILFN